MKCVLLMLAACMCLSAYAKLQNITVKGIAVCNKRRQANAKIELYDRDTLDPNDLLASIHTNSNGEFELFGEEDEVGKIEPFVRISHNCNTKPGCTRVSDYEAPQDKIGGTYDMTFVTLDIVVHGEKTNC